MRKESRLGGYCYKMDEIEIDFMYLQIKMTAARGRRFSIDRVYGTMGEGYCVTTFQRHSVSVMKAEKCK